MITLSERISTSLKNYKWFWMGILILLGANLYFYVSKQIATNRHHKELLIIEQQYEEEARLALDKNAKEQLSLMIKTFVWAVRSAMIRSNMDEVDQYFNELVHEENIHEIVLAGRDGQILVSTNKKHQSKLFGQFYPADILNQQDVFFTLSADKNEYHVAAPVLSLNNRLGTLFLVYATDKFKLETSSLPVKHSPIEKQAKDTLLAPQPVDSDSSATVLK